MLEKALLRFRIAQGRRNFARRIDGKDRDLLAAAQLYLQHKFLSACSREWSLLRPPRAELTGIFVTSIRYRIYSMAPQGHAGRGPRAGAAHRGVTPRPPSAGAACGASPGCVCRGEPKQGKNKAMPKHASRLDADIQRFKNRIIAVKSKRFFCIRQKSRKKRPDTSCQKCRGGGRIYMYRLKRTMLFATDKNNIFKENVS